MKLDWTMNVGNVVTALVLLFGFYRAHIEHVRKLQEIETRLGTIYEWFQSHVLEGS